MIGVVPLHIDFLHGALNYRRQHGGGKNQLIAKAVGIKSKQTLSVLDTTAGLGRDGFVLACLGCDVTMCERSIIVYTALQDALWRAQKETWFATLKLQLKNTDALHYFAQITAENKPDVVYIDPMFPEKTKSALVKKEIRTLRRIVGDDLDAAILLDAAFNIAKKRIVVKRAKLAPTLTNRKPNIVYQGKSSRFDVYLVGN